MGQGRRAGDGDGDKTTVVALREGQPAPAFALPDAAGGSVSLDDFRGKPVLLYFSMGYG